MLLSVAQPTTAVSRVYNEDLTGLVNGANTVFTTAVIFVPGQEAVHFNGVRQREGVANDYVRSESVPAAGYDTITFAVAPRSRSGARTNDAITIDYDPS